MSDEVLDLFQNTQTQTFFLVACVALIAYDVFLLIDQEIELIWLRPISHWTVLYLINRYGALAFFTYLPLQQTGHSIIESCATTSILIIFAQNCSIFVVILIAQLRVCVMYKNDKRIQVISYIVAASHFVVILLTAILTATSEPFLGRQSIDGFSFCPELVPVPRLLANLDLAQDIVSILHTLLPMCLATIKAFRHYQNQPVQHSHGSVMAGVVVFGILVKDTLLYGIIGFFFLNLFTWETSFKVQLLQRPIHALACIIMSRLVIKIPKRFRDLNNPQSTPSTSGMEMISGIRFAGPATLRMPSDQDGLRSEGVDDVPPRLSIQLDE